ncbi:MAG: hypothetical protein Kow0047_34490 [Anaerolineae bacterium]
MEVWARQVAAERPELLAVGLFGSYARGDWGVGSDADLVLVVEDSPRSFEARAADWDVTSLPVPADVLVYTRSEWEAMAERRFRQTIEREAIWVYRRSDEQPLAGP